MEYRGESIETLMEEIENGGCVYCEFTPETLTGDYLTPIINHMRFMHAHILPAEFARLRVERRETNG